MWWTFNQNKMLAFYVSAKPGYVESGRFLTKNKFCLNISTNGYVNVRAFKPFVVILTIQTCILIYV